MKNFKIIFASFFETYCTDLTQYASDAKFAAYTQTDVQIALYSQYKAQGIALRHIHLYTDIVAFCELESLSVPTFADFIDFLRTETEYVKRFATPLDVPIYNDKAAYKEGNERMYKRNTKYVVEYEFNEQVLTID